MWKCKRFVHVKTSQWVERCFEVNWLLVLLTVKCGLKIDFNCGLQAWNLSSFHSKSSSTNCCQLGALNTKHFLSIFGEIRKAKIIHYSYLDSHTSARFPLKTPEKTKANRNSNGEQHFLACSATCLCLRCFSWTAFPRSHSFSSGTLPSFNILFLLSFPLFPPRFTRYSECFHSSRG